MTTQRLLKRGLMSNEILTVVTPPTPRDRTYQSALSLKKALKENQIQKHHLHLMTVGPHGRRSKLLFKKALGKEYQIGVTSLPPSSYDPAHCYRTSAGVRDVIGEWIAYLYAKFIFRP
jgi:hypothetical protein